MRNGVGQTLYVTRYVTHYLLCQLPLTQAALHLRHAVELAAGALSLLSILLLLELQ